VHLIAKSLVKRFGNFVAVDHAEFELEPGEFLSLLGPSGCGKTTILRMLAGFHQPDAGRIVLAGNDITSVPARHRNIGMVFQNYALFPHMSVAENVAFGLRMRRMKGAEIRRRVDSTLELVQMSGYHGARPTELSGGQQQRVALARALVIEPTLLLLDEPLSALDLKLREELREEISRITGELDITTVFVTHDQNEALVLSDRVAVMNEGRIEQLDAPEELYRRPRTPFVARFLGGANVLNGIVTQIRQSGSTLDVGDGVTLDLAGNLEESAVGSPLAVAIRPEALQPAAAGEITGLRAIVEKRRYLGSHDEYVLSAGTAGRLIMRLPAGDRHDVGDELQLRVPADAIVPLTPADKARHRTGGAAG